MYKLVPRADRCDLARSKSLRLFFQDQAFNRSCFFAAGPAARSSRSVGVFGKGAEVRDTLEESGILRGGFHFAMMAFRACLTARFITF